MPSHSIQLSTYWVIHKLIALVFVTILLMSAYPLVAIAGIVPMATWSPDGSRLAVTDGEWVTIFDEAFRTLQTIPADDPMGFTELAWSPDGRNLIIGREIWQGNPLSRLLRVQLPFTQNQLLGWSQDGSQVYAYSNDGLGAAIYDARQGTLVRSVNPQLPTAYTLFDLKWSPDDRHFAATAVITPLRGSQMVIFDATTGEIVSRYPSATSTYITGNAGGIVWNPNSQEVVFSYVAEVEPGTPGSYVWQLPPPLDGPYLPVTVIMDVMTGRENLIINEAPLNYGYFQWNRDGTELIGATGDAIFTVWSRQNAEVLHNFTLDIRPSTLALSPFDGRLVVTFTPPASRSPLDVVERSQFRDANLSVRQYLDGTLAMVVPAPSIQRLESITARCGLPVQTESTLDTQAATDLTTFAIQVEALPDSQISPACRADLLAVAAALQASP